MTLDLGPVGEVDEAGWRTVLGLAERERPVAVVVEGTWWRDEHERRRLGLLEDVRELGVPDMHIGTWGEHTLIYACPYGAPATAEVVQMASLIGVRLAVQIGSCGILTTSVQPGDVVVPTETLGLDGTTSHYRSDLLVPSSEQCSDEAANGLGRLGVTAHQGPSVTWPTLFNQPLERAREWSREGYLGVDMETATTLAVASHFGVAGVSMLVAWDEVLSDRSFLDPLPEAQAAAFRRAEDAVFDVALELAECV